MHRSVPLYYYYSAPTRPLFCASATRRVVQQSSLELQHKREQQQQHKILDFLATQSASASSSWLVALHQLIEARDTGTVLTPSTLAPVIRVAPTWDVAKYLYFDVQRSLVSPNDGSVITSNDDAIGLAMVDAAAKYGQWQFALSYLTRVASGSSDRQQRLEKDAAQRLLHTTIKSLHRSAMASAQEQQETGVSNSRVSHWAVALAVTSVLRQPQKHFEFSRASLGFSERKAKKNRGAREEEAHHHTDIIVVEPRKSTALPAVDATPALIEHLMPLLATSGRWAECHALLRAADRQHIAVSPAVLEHVIRVCYAADKHDIVAAIANRMIAEEAPVREQVARLCLRSLETVAAAALTTRHREQYGDDASGSGSSTTGAGGGGGLLSLLASTSSVASRAWFNSLRIFTALADQGLALTRQSYESPLRCCAVSGRWVEATRLVAEMRRDGLHAGQNNLETVICAKITHGCATAEEAYALLRTALPARHIDVDSKHQPIGIIQPKTARAFNAVLAVAVRENNRKVIAAVLQHMRRAEIQRDIDTQKWLIRAAFKAQRWDLVLRQFLFLRREILTDVERAKKGGFDLAAIATGGEYDLDDDVARMVLEACEMIGLSDPLAKNITEAVLEAKRHRRHNQEADDDDEEEAQKLLPSSSNQQTRIRDLAKRADELKRQLRRAELGDDVSRLPGEKKPTTSATSATTSTASAPSSSASSRLGEALGISNQDEAELFSPLPDSSSAGFMSHYTDIPEVPPA